MYFSITECNESLYQEAKNFFINQGRSNFLLKKKDSLIGAYLITKHLRSLGNNDYNYQEGVYSYGNIFFSTSHSNNTIIIASHTKKIAVDLEFIRARDQSLLKDSINFDNSLSVWQNFYIYRCSKECLVKLLNLNLEDIKNLEIKSFTKDLNFSFDENIFEYSLKVEFQNRIYEIHLSIDNNKIIALSYI